MDQSYLTQIPPELAMEILYKLEPYQVRQACLLGKHFAQKVCTPNFWNLYILKNAKRVFYYDIFKNKFTDIGKFYDIIGTSGHNIILSGLKGNVNAFDITTNKLSLLAEAGIRKYITNTAADINYAIDYNGNLVVLTPEKFKIVATPLYGFKVKNAILYLKKALILYANGDLHYTAEYIDENLSPFQSNVKQIVSAWFDHDVVILYTNGNLAKLDLRNKQLKPIATETKFEYIQPNSDSNKLFLTDKNDYGWLLNIVSFKDFIALGMKLKQGLLFNRFGSGIFVGLSFDGILVYKTIITKEKIEEQDESKMVKHDFKLFNSPTNKKAVKILNLNDNLVISYYN